MYKVIHTDKTINKIDKFTKSYRNSFIRLFEDSWLFMEKEIIGNYIKLWSKLHDLIFFEIDFIFTSSKIYWISKTKSWKLFTTISINNFRLFVYYKEEKTENLRIIKDIEFFRK